MIKVGNTRGLYASVSLALAVSLLSACGTPKTDSSSSSAEVSSSATTESSSSIQSSSVAVSSSSSSSQVVSSSSASNDGPPSILASPGTFDDGQGFFTTYFNLEESVVASASFNGEAALSISQIAGAPEPWHVQLQHILTVNQGQSYTVCFKAKADSSRSLMVDIDTAEPDYASVNPNGPTTFSLSTSYQSFSYTLTANVSDTTARLLFNAGDNTVNVQLDDIGVYEGSQCGAVGVVDGGDPGTGSGNIDGVPAITTQGNQVLFGGQAGSIAGMSHFWSNWSEGSIFYNEGVVSTVKSWGGKLIRAAMGVDAEDGYLTNPQANVARVRAVVDAAIANEMYVIIDWHTHNAEDYPAEAIAFFKEMAQAYGEYDNVIYEIYNEPDCPTGTYPCPWGSRTQWSEIKAYAEQVIPEIRAIDPDNLIIVGTPYYSQDVDAAASNPIQGHANIAYTLHFYAGTHKGDIRGKALTALQQGIPLFVTEWGTVGASGDGAVDHAETDTWMQFLYDNNISHANWSISNKDEGASLLKPSAGANGGWSDSDLTESGLKVKNIIETW